MPIPGYLPAQPAEPGTILQRRYLRVGDGPDQLVLGAVDDIGSYVYLVDLIGWDGATGTTLSSEQKYADDGAWLSAAYLPARTIEAQVQIVAASSVDVVRSQRLLAGRLPHRQRRQMLVDDNGLQLVAAVQQNGEVLATRKAHVAKLSIPLIADDPRRYEPDVVEAITGLPVTSGGLRVLNLRAPFRVEGVTDYGVLEVDNNGNEVSLPVFTIQGPCPAFTLTHVGTLATIRYHEDVPEGRTVVIDTAARTALVDGTAARYVTGAWFGYTPGPNQVAFAAGSYDPDALLVSRHRHAWK